MKFRTVQVDERVIKNIEICKQIFIKHHPHYELYHLSNSKIILEALIYYINTESGFEVETDEK